MNATLLPDDPAAAEQIVKLMRDNAGLRAALRRTVEERDYWRARANRDDADYQEGKGDWLYHSRQEDRA